MGTTETTDAHSGVDRVHTDIHIGDREAAGSHIEATSDNSIDYTDREAFGLRLQQHYHQHAINETPFLLIAMRGDGVAATSLDFSLFYECARKLLTKQDDWLVDSPGQRLIVILPRSRSDAAQRFFARLKVRLIETVPQQAETYLHAVSAIVVPNGESFQNAEDFLGVALEEK